MRTSDFARTSSERHLLALEYATFRLERLGAEHDPVRAALEAEKLSTVFHDSVSLLRLMLFDDVTYHRVRTWYETLESEVISKLPADTAEAIRVAAAPMRYASPHLFDR